jgi:hypothetical protein
MVKNCLEKFVVDDWKTQMLSKFLELSKSNGIFTSSTIQFLDGKESLLYFLPYILLVFSTSLNIRVTAEIEFFLQ